MRSKQAWAGTFFAMEHFGVVADVVSVAKGIASGLPLGAIIARAEIMKSWKPGQHASTFGANPVAVSAALDTLDVIESEKLLENARKMGKIAMRRLFEWKEKYELVGDVRGMGLFIGVEIVKSKSSKERGEKETLQIVSTYFEKSLIAITAGRNTIRIIPPLTINEKALNEGLDLLEWVVSNTSNGKQ